VAGNIQEHIFLAPSSSCPSTKKLFLVIPEWGLD